MRAPCCDRSHIVQEIIQSTGYRSHDSQNRFGDGPSSGLGHEMEAPRKIHWCRPSMPLGGVLWSGDVKLLVDVERLAIPKLEVGGFLFVSAVEIQAHLVVCRPLDQSTYRINHKLLIRIALGALFHLDVCSNVIPPTCDINAKLVVSCQSKWTSLTGCRRLEQYPMKFGVTGPGRDA